MEEKQPEKDEKLESQQSIKKKTNGLRVPAGPPYTRLLPRRSSFESLFVRSLNQGPTGLSKEEFAASRL